MSVAVDGGGHVRKKVCLAALAQESNSCNFVFGGF